MLKLSLGEFRTRLNAMTDRTFVYDSRNQPDGRTGHLVSTRYDTAQLFLKPDSVCFKNDNGFFCLRNPRWASIDESEPAVGTIITIGCADAPGSGDETTYVFLADKRPA